MAETDPPADRFADLRLSVGQAWNDDVVVSRDLLADLLREFDHLSAEAGDTDES